MRTAIPAAAMAVGLAVSAGNAWSATPAATVKPSTKLTNGQTVTVKWSGFAKTGNKFIVIVQCTAKIVDDQNQDHCDTSHPTILGDGIANMPAKGTGTYAVATGTIGKLHEKCGTKAANKDDCIIAVAGLDGSLNPNDGQNATVAIVFK